MHSPNVGLLFKYFFVALSLIFSVSPVSAVEDSKSKGDDEGKYHLSGTVKGLAEKLLVELNDDEIVKISGDGDFKFKTKFNDQQEYVVKIKKPAPNHRCEINNGRGIVTSDEKSKVDIVCQQIGKWEHPATIADSLSPNGQNAATPAAALDGRGNGVVAWSQYDGKNWRIFKSEYRDNKWHNPASLKEAISPKNSDAKNPKVAIAGNGEIVIVWEQLFKKASYLMMAEKRKGEWRFPKSLKDHISPGENYAWHSNVAMDDQGNTVIVWSQEYSAKSYSIYMSEYRKGSWHHPVSTREVISPAGGIAVYPKVAINNKGMSLITWYQNPERFDNIYASIYQGGAWKHPTNGNNYINAKAVRQGAFTPVPALSDNGRAVIAWQQFHENRVRIYKSEFDGSIWSQPLSTDAISPMTRENDNAEINSIAMDNKGNALILWTLQRVFNQALYLSKLENGKWKHQGENDYLVGQRKERHLKVMGDVAMSDTGKSVIVWKQRRADKITQLFMTEFGNGVWRLPGKQLGLLDYSVSNVAVSSAKNGDFLVVWQQSDGKFEQIYKSEFHLLKK